MRLYELAYCCRLFDQQSNGDDTLRRLLDFAGGSVDLGSLPHRRALVEWLRSWGCRTLATEDTQLTLASLARWWRQAGDDLPRTSARLQDLDELAVDRAASVYGPLAELHASYRRAASKRVRVSLGPTAAAKALFALRPNVYPPWDEPIRRKYGYDGSTASYRAYLSEVRNELRELFQDAKECGVEPRAIPAIVNRPRSTLPKLVDEYLWVRITAGHEPPSRSDVARWHQWSRRAR
jgi:hypothetical protein